MDYDVRQCVFYQVSRARGSFCRANHTRMTNRVLISRNRFYDEIERVLYKFYQLKFTEKQ